MVEEFITEKANLESRNGNLTESRNTRLME